MIEKVGVIGSGTMGFGIAFQLVSNGTKVILVDSNEQALRFAQLKLSEYLKIFKEEGYLFKDSDEAIMQRITFTTTISEVANCDLVIESATENLQLKKKIFKELDQICHQQAILTSNTSSLKLSDITKNVVHHKERVLLTHFFNPAHIVPLVELLKGHETQQTVYDEVAQFMEDMGKVTIEVHKEVPGLVANRIQTALAREALALLEDGVISEEDLEKVLFAGPGFRYASSGILKIMDFGGLDVWRIVLAQLQPEIESNVRKFDILEEKVVNGQLGVKSSSGFFDYPGKGLDELVIARDRSLIKQLKTFKEMNGGKINA
ncbi:3-hydroxyacyl-CoA dehydrogenase family protein [Kurthia sibirica]|uniref:L-gulonate 3-dehydrogenase n=1 Tax=Kurthia sibirica TaxID=202750 RepID=A0A2U3AN08_9BACL|nr:3-hydroxyacyl-CoA dehydrogenase family protein [Kurthia sibirica]PWI25912.1 3-hydroxyacyl-CoA dehydrogenase [Kurthia sibirica]GEK34267.1 3-hydroxybutyryl-CoA dehydrogenase [Kurthia sibirica]